MEEMGSGVLQGGWEYVTAAYVITWVFFIGYTVSLWTRHPGERRD